MESFSNVLFKKCFFYLRKNTDSYLFFDVLVEKPLISLYSLTIIS